MFKEKQKNRSLIISLLILLAANGGWGIQVSETLIFRHF